MSRLLVVHHSPTPVSQALTEAVLAGTRAPELAEAGSGDLEIVSCHALEAGIDDLAAADGLLLGTTANFGYMSGALKHFFDTVFLAAGGALAPDGGGDGGALGSSATKLPYGLWVHGRYDTTGATRSVLSIAGALPWRQMAPPLEILGDVGDVEREAAYELGATLAALTLEER
ncbi:flavodoxin family protein [Nocardioides gilvus]|uniref:flavodoxin family protein n=1 Tax=Nocardioides gilvus TaxID=1735589 RepID=UPI000D7463FA|nr:flavodoxin family protein [Nocardioides gilvus]